ncbi:MAG: S8 family serine peptidase [Micromonosporaceae bacterium]|nr:S8 family serine peptidase [Micromonosporaceae bacterium]
MTIAAVVSALLLLPPVAAAAAPTSPAPAAPGRYIVTLAPGAEVSTTLHRHQIVASHRYEQVLHGFAAALSGPQLAALRDQPGVTRIEPDGAIHTTATQLDPPSWGLDRVDQRNLPLDDSYTFNTTAADVHAYIIDTGIDIGHNDFGGRASFAVNTVGGPNRDCNGHGTHVAGTTGAASFGVAKEVNLYAVKVLNCAGSGSVSSVIAGMDWVAANHTKPAVANLSLGGGFNASINESLDNLADTGVFVAAAAGNENIDACTTSPASAANSTSVMASDINDNRASFSNFGPCTHLYAPGVAIVSTFPRNGAAIGSGTSMAAPHVTGVAAMFKATFGDSSFDTIRGWLVDNATAGVISGNPPNTPNLLLFTNNL